MRTWKAALIPRLGEGRRCSGCCCTSCRAASAAASDRRRAVGGRVGDMDWVRMVFLQHTGITAREQTRYTHAGGDPTRPRQAGRKPDDIFSHGSRSMARRAFRHGGSCWPDTHVCTGWSSSRAVGPPVTRPAGPGSGGMTASHRARTCLPSTSRRVMRTCQEPMDLVVITVRGASGAPA